MQINRKKYGSTIITLLLTGMLPTMAIAGVGSSGGGMAVACRGPDGRIEKSILLDLYEGVIGQGLTLRPTLGSLDREWVAYTQELRKIVDDPRPISQADIAAFHQELTYERFLPIGQHPAPTFDLGQTVPVPVGCKIEQLANYNDQTNILTIDTEIWQSLDSLSQGALEAHETVYREYRGAGDRTSENVRHLVARLFSTTPPVRERDGVPANAYTLWATSTAQLGPSTSGDTLFYLFTDPQNPNQTVMQFARILGRDTFGPVRVAVSARLNPKDLRMGHKFKKWFPLFVENPGDHIGGVTAFHGGDLFEGYGMAVEFEYGKPFMLTLLDSKGRVVGQALASECTEGARAY